MNLDSANLGIWTANEVVSNSEQISSYVEERLVEQNCTAIEVFPTSTEIIAGTIDSDTGLEYKVDIPPSNTLLLQLYVLNDKKNSDVVIDFGDGTIVKFKEHQFSNQFECYEYITSELSSDVYNVMITHKYMQTDKKFIVKLYGSGITMLRGDYQLLTGANIISRVFAKDLPIHSKIQNISSICRNSLRVQQIVIPYGYYANITNWSNAFLGCTNLINAYGNGITNDNKMMTMDYMFYKCENLVHSDFALAPFSSLGSNIAAYADCKNLEEDISNLLPKSGFSNGQLNIAQAFQNCMKLYGKIPYETFNNLANKNLIGVRQLYTKEFNLPTYPINWTIYIPEIVDILPSDPSHFSEKVYFQTSDETLYAVKKVGSSYEYQKYAKQYEYFYALNDVPELSQKKDCIYKLVKNPDSSWHLDLYDDTYSKYALHAGGMTTVSSKKYNYSKYDIVRSTVYTKDDGYTYLTMEITNDSSALPINYPGFTFYGCSEEIRSQVPKCFGGTLKNPTELDVLSDIEWTSGEVTFEDMLKTIATRLGATIK